MFCWANENWSRVWEGKEKDIIIQQDYSDEDDLQHIQYLIPYFKDERYIRVNGKPVIAIYNSNCLPNPKTTINTWRKEAANHGLELYICRFESLGFYGKNLSEDAGFDAAIDFQPSGHVFDRFKESIAVQQQKNYIKRARHSLYKKLVRTISPEHFGKYITNLYKRTSYREFVEFAIKLPFPNYKWYPCITPMWDNTARKGKNSFLFKDSTPELYYRWLKSIKAKFKPFSKDENLIFINAWNEWAEGNHLEPCARWGRSYLEATKKALQEDVDENTFEK
jgi:lipopolysaccharide biosynthesis protein